MYFTYEEIDRTLFELIRIGIVSKGYLPDLTAYSADPESYVLAKETLKASLPDHELIEVYGTGPPESRDEKTVSKIIIDRKEAPEGTLGGFPVMEYEPILNSNNVLTGYDKFQMPENSRTIKYEIRYMTNSVKYSRIITTIIDNALGTKRYIYPVKDDGTFDKTKFMFIKLTNDVAVGGEKIIESVLTYEIIDVFIQERRKINVNPIAPLQTVIDNPDVIPSQT